MRAIRVKIAAEHGNDLEAIVRALTELGLQFHLDAVMAQPTTRDRIVEALKDLPEDATFQDAIERLVLLAKIDIGLAELDAGKGIPHSEVKRRLGV